MHIMISYPKSGRTWVRFMVNRYLIELLKTPTDDVVIVEKDLAKSPNEILWTHFYAAMFLEKPYWDMGAISKQIIAHPCIFLARNFYGTIASAYYHGQYRKKFFNYDSKTFLRCPRFGIVKLVSFYNQMDELRQKSSNFTIFRYGNLQANTRDCFVKILQALSQPIDDVLVDQVVEEGKLANMQVTAAEPRYAGTWLGEVNPNADMNENVTVGNNKKYHQLFDAEDIDYIAQMIDLLLVNKDADYLQGCLTPPPVKQ
jgi:alcohol sulfotransferase